MTTPVKPESSGQILAQVKRDLLSVEFQLNRQLFPIADLLAKAKEAYEAETRTGKGKRNPSRLPDFVSIAARKLERSPTTVERLLRLSTIDLESRKLIWESPTLGANQDALLELVKVSPQARKEAITAYKQGRAAFDATIDRLRVQESPSFKKAVFDVLEAKANKSLIEPETQPEELNSSEPATSKPSTVLQTYMLDIGPRYRFRFDGVEITIRIPLVTVSREVLQEAAKSASTVGELKIGRCLVWISRDRTKSRKEVRREADKMGEATTIDGQRLVPLPQKTP